MKYCLNPNTSFDVGFPITTPHVQDAVDRTNKSLFQVPNIFYQDLDLKTIGSIVGSKFITHVTQVTSAIRNPAARGFPDLIPKGTMAIEQVLRNYPLGIEVKTTMIGTLNWRAHHNQVTKLLGVTWGMKDNHPYIHSVYHSLDLQPTDWYAVSGGKINRSTNSTTLNAIGKKKMQNGWIVKLAN